MSKDNVVKFLTNAAGDDRIKDKLQEASSSHEVANIGKEAGYEFEPEHVDEALTHMKEQRGFFHALAEAALRIFGPSEDNYPATGVQPFGGDTKTGHQ